MNLCKYALATLSATVLDGDGDEEEKDSELWPPKKKRKTHNDRQRRYINSIFKELTPPFVRRAYRMDAPSFWKLKYMLDPYLDAQVKRTSKQKGGGARNGIINNGTRLNCAIRYFAGGRAEDIMLVHGISHCQVFVSVWRVVDDVNQAVELRIKYPNCHSEQQRLALEFKRKSQAGFDNCAGAIDCMVIWTEQPSLASCKAASCGRLKFFCGRKKKYGIGLQGTCDAQGRFLDFSMGHPATTSDFLAFSTSSIFYKLKEPGFLAEGLVLYGDNAYVSTDYMATPYRNIRSGPKDDYNFYHSQVRRLILLLLLFVHSSCHSPLTAIRFAQAGSN